MLRKGTKSSTFLAFAKEVYPSTTDSGKRRVKRAFFQCTTHPENYHKMTHQNARREDRKSCPCNNSFNEGSPVKVYTKEEVDNYSYLKDQNWHRNALKKTPADWFRVTRMGIFLKKEDGTNLLFYKFEKTDKKSPEYKVARRIENSIWNRPKVNQAFYLTRLSYEFDELHSRGKMKFKSELWSRGAGMEFFKELLYQHCQDKPDI